MNRSQERFKRSVRITWAIAAKDIVDAIKNKTTISVIVGVAAVMLSSQAMPLLAKVSSIHTVATFDAGESQLIGQLKRNREIRLIRAASQQEMENILAESGGVALGLSLPADFDQTLGAGQALELQGYYMHWVSRSDAISEQTFFEEQLSQLIGKPALITIAGNAIYPRSDSSGQPYMVSFSLVIAIITISGFLVPYLMIEEKQTKTMEALLVSPAHISQVVAGKAIAGTVYGLAAAAVVFAFNRALVVHWPLAITGAVCGTLFAVAVGLLLGTVFDNPQNLTVVAGLVMTLLLVPVFLTLVASKLPEWLTNIMPWMPSAALAQVFRISFAGTVAKGEVALNGGVVVGSAALLLAAVVWKVRRSDR